MSGTGLGRAAACHRLHPFFLKWEEMVVEGDTKKVAIWGWVAAKDPVLQRKFSMEQLRKAIQHVRLA